MSRRLIAALVLLLALGTVAPVDAGKGWCRSDPIITTGGVTYAVLGMAESQIDSVVYEITSPNPVTVVFETHGMAVNESTVIKSGPLKFRLLTSNGEATPIQFIVAKRQGGTESRYGTANTPLTIYGW